MYWKNAFFLFDREMPYIDRDTKSFVAKIQCIASGETQAIRIPAHLAASRSLRPTNLRTPARHPSRHIRYIAPHVR
jgi:hypothetical protein